MAGTAMRRMRYPYDPRSVTRLAFRDVVPRFHAGADTPRAYLERCLAVIEAREPDVRAFAATNLPAARASADASTERYRAGRPLSIVDGMPFGIKDLFETRDMPTELNSRVYKGWQSFRDSAHVVVMRRGGAAIVGKTTTTEFGVADPPPTRNPFDTGRTAGGSSSGSAASVGAGMLPAASGTQARASIIRPAGYCGNYALKPTFGAINRGGGQGVAPTHSVLGVHAMTLRDMWETSFYMATAAGGDPGQPGLYGEPALPAAVKPERLIRLDTLGWSVTDEPAKEEFERLLRRLGNEVTIVSRRDDPRIEALEQGLARIPEFMFAILGYDMRWPIAHYREMGAEKLSQTLLGYLAPFEAMTPEQYRAALKQRDALRALFAGIRDIAPFCIAPAQPGAAPEGMGIGNPVYGDVTSVLGSPAIALPLMAVEEMPFAAQLMGQPHEDYRLCAAAHWLAGWALGD